MQIVEKQSEQKGDRVELLKIKFKLRTSYYSHSSENSQDSTENTSILSDSGRNWK